MEHKHNSFFQFIAWTLILFAADILMMMLIAALFGEMTKGMSTMFQFGSKGLASTTMLQFLLSAAVTVLLKNLFYSDLISKKMMALWRTILMLLSILLVHMVFILLFGWFRYDNHLAWAGFFICFGGGFLIGSSAMILKTKLDSRRYDELLYFYKEQREEDNNE
ncbi:MAG TPA: hypothetical protein GXX75_03360 [Clostridiales bacterium]|nr:hypothetical protein [Clostridiales bacterium]